MHGDQSKKLIIMGILDVLKRYTDENHRLSQKEIADILKREYSLDTDRKAIKRNLMNLIDSGYEIEYKETTRSVVNQKTGETEENILMSDFYLVRDFTEAELRLLIDSLLFSMNIPQKQCMDLIEKLEGLSSKYFQSKVKHVCSVPVNNLRNKQMFYTVEALDEAISKGVQVSFTYSSYGTDKKLYPRLDDNGEPRIYLINPYQIAASRGMYYLICNNDKYADLSNYRVDRITDIRVLETRVKPMSKVKGLENGFNLPKHMAEHVYMYTGESQTVKFQLKKGLVTDVLDWFGNEIDFIDEDEEWVTAKVKVNLQAMRRWGLQYALDTRILAPASLVEEVKKDIENARINYGL